MKKYLICILSFLFLISCASTKLSYPAAKDFNESDSDPKAIALANETMQAMGGYKNWQKTRFISWNFFGARKLMWDKHSGLVKIESEKDKYKVIVNINDNTGQVMLDNSIQTHPDTLTKYLDMAKSIWINDSYWLVMPFKLKDSGVTLKYIESGKTNEGLEADILSLSFKEVGDTPNNKYHVYIDKKTKLVSQWDFFTNATDEKARFSTPWKGYKTYGKILLSDSRGENYDLTDIQVSQIIPADLFKEL